MSFVGMWREIELVGRDPRTGGYRRFAWTREDAALREWFTAQAVARGLDLTTDRAGNLWAWTSDPDAAVAAGRPGVVLGSHLDSVPDGGAFDGPLGVVGAFAALDVLGRRGWAPDRPVGVVCFADEEGARFGVACAGSRILTGALDPDRARGLTDDGGTSLGEAARAAGVDVDTLGRDDETLRRVGTFLELHIEQGRALADLPDAPVAVASAIWPHGRWRLDLPGRADHAGTTRLEDRDDPMLRLADVVSGARVAAHRHGALATVGKVDVRPNGVNAIAASVTAWLDARGPAEDAVRRVVADVGAAAGVEPAEESWTPAVDFPVGLRDELAGVLGGVTGGVPVLPTGAGHDAGILAAAGVPAAMLFVRNPTGTSHSPSEHADEADCLAGVEALAEVVAHLTGGTRE